MGVSIFQPMMDSGPALTEPEEELFVTQAARLASQSTKNWAASVATARYRPRMRRLGRPKITPKTMASRSEEHTSELQSHSDLVCRLLLEKKKKTCKSESRRRPLAVRRLDNNWNYSEGETGSV